MKKGVVLLIIILASQLIAGQGRYEEMLRAVALSAGGNDIEAAAVLTGLINAAPDAELLLLRGDAYLRSGKVTEAKSDFMAAESMNQGSGLYGLARCAAAGGDARAAVSYLEAHLKSQFRKSEPEIMLDKSFGSIQSSPEWKSLWKKDWYKGYERKSWEIDHYLRIGKTDLAEEVWRELVSSVFRHACHRLLQCKDTHSQGPVPRCLSTSCTADKQVQMHLHHT